MTTIHKATSQTIAVARVLCIACVIYVHVPPYGATLPASLAFHDTIVWFVREIVGRSSVPLLSIISGFLAARLSAQQDWAQTLVRKTTTLLVPLALWNAIALAGDVALSPATAIPHWNELPRLLLGFDGFPRLMPLYFLRDVFVCSLLAPCLRTGLRMASGALMAALLVNAVLDLDGRFFLSSAIPLFYALGLGLGEKRWPARIVEDHRQACLAAAMASLVLIAALPFIAPESAFAGEGAPLSALRLILQRGAGAVAFWCLAAGIVRRGNARPMLLLEPAIFFVFCSHPLVIGLIRRLVEPAAGATPGAVSTAAFLLSPPIVIAACLTVLLALRLCAPGLLRLLMAGKPPRDDQLRALLKVLRTMRRRKAPDLG